MGEGEDRSESEKDAEEELDEELEKCVLGGRVVVDMVAMVVVGGWRCVDLFQVLLVVEGE